MRRLSTASFITDCLHAAGPLSHLRIIDHVGVMTAIDHGWSNTSPNSPVTPTSPRLNIPEGPGRRLEREGGDAGAILVLLVRCYASEGQLLVGALLLRAN